MLLYVRPISAANVRMYDENFQNEVSLERLSGSLLSLVYNFVSSQLVRENVNPWKD